MSNGRERPSGPWLAVLALTALCVCPSVLAAAPVLAEVHADPAGQDVLLTMLKVLGVPGGVGVALMAVARWCIPPLLASWKELIEVHRAFQREGGDRVKTMMDQQQEVNKSQSALTEALNNAHNSARDLVRECRDLQNDLKLIREQRT